MSENKDEKIKFYGPIKFDYVFGMQVLMFPYKRLFNILPW